MYKKCKVVMLSTDKASELGLYNNKLYDSTFGTKTDNWINQYLYIISDDEIKAGDWYYAIDTKVMGKARENDVNGVFKGQYKHTYKKIVATTDSSLSVQINKPEKISNRIFEQLPSIPQSFIDRFVSEYNKGNKIEEVMVEYEHVDTEFVGYALSGDILKLNPDNTINIKSIKDSWTREEVITIINQTFYLDSRLDLEEWIESNL